MFSRIPVGVGLVAVLAACSSETPQSPAVPGPDLSAAVETLFKGWFPLNPPPAGIPNACTGENVLFSGTYNLIVRSVSSPSGHSQFRVHSQANVVGVGAVSGMKYQSTDILNLTETVGPGDGAVFNLTYKILTISRGGAGNSAGRMLIKITVNAIGVVTVDRALFEFDVCRGGGA